MAESEDPRMRLMLQAKYWDKLWRAITTRMKKEPKEFRGWRLVDNKAPGSQYYSIGFQPESELNRESKRLYCYPALQQQRPKNQFEMILGIFWSQKTPAVKEPKTAKLTELRNYLRKKYGMTGPTYSWLVAWRKEGYQLYRPEVLVQLADSNTLEDLQADQFLEFFLDTRARIAGLNAALP